MLKSKLIFLVVLTIISSSLVAKPMTQEAKAIKGEFIIKVKDGFGDSFLDKLHANGFDSLIKDAKDLNVSLGNFFKITVDRNANGFAAGMDLKAMYPEIEVVEPNYIYEMQLIDNDVMDKVLSLGLGKGKKKGGNNEDPKVKNMFGDLWGLENTGDNEPADSRGNNTSVSGVEGADIAAKKAWKVYKNNHMIKIAVIDTGVDYKHPDLAANIMVNEDEIPNNGKDDDGNGYVDDFYGYDFLNNDADPMDDHGHGTHCSGTIAGVHNKFGVAGVIAKAKILPVKFLGVRGGSLEGAIKSIDYATVREVDIMSNSWGGGGRSQLLEDAISRAADKGILFVAAAGNHRANNDLRPSYPASYPVRNVISVAAHNYGDKITSFSCYGKKSVHIAAPGRNILSTTVKVKTTEFKHYNVWSGTSMATPHVSGALALLLSHEGRMDVEEAKHRLMETSVKGENYSEKVASGRLNAYRLLENIRD